jgi:hypothetical protein
VVVVRATLDGDSAWTASDADLAALESSDQVVAIITGGTPENEQSGEYAPYSLMVNGAERADGAGL